MMTDRETVLAVNRDATVFFAPASTDRKGKRRSRF